MIRTIIAGVACILLAPVHAFAQQAPPLPGEDVVPIAILVDLSSGQILHQRNAERRFMPASITKVMTTYVAFGMLRRGELEASQRLTFDRAAFEEWGGRGSTMFLNANEAPRVSQLLMGITTVSANDASIVLAQGAANSLSEWLKLMNGSAQSLGMKDSHFGTPNGWPDEGRTFTTASDLALLGKALIHEFPDHYARYYGHRELTYRGITQPNREPFSGQFAGGDGVKTGYTNEAGFGVLGSAERDGRRLLLVVAGANQTGDRDRAARAYMEWGFSRFDSKPLFSPGELIGKARVQGGDALSVGLTTPRPISTAMPIGAERSVELSIEYQGPVRAPIAQGEQIAELKISVEGMEPSRVPLYATEDVGTAGPFARVLNGIIGWFR